MLEEHRNVTLEMDIMYINKIPFIVSKSRATHFGTVEMIKDEKKGTIITSLQQVINTYHGIGFKTRHILAVRKFKCITKQMELMGIKVNTTACDKHVPEVERYNRTIKD